MIERGPVDDKLNVAQLPVESVAAAMSGAVHRPGFSATELRRWRIIYGAKVKIRSRAGTRGLALVQYE
ncbi:MAG: hypothetical protein KGL35_21710 [Bradyrhizobium sp.]|nr:hypothetical protein [Bradyrhizobium sp.]